MGDFPSFFGVGALGEILWEPPLACVLRVGQVLSVYWKLQLNSRNYRDLPGGTGLIFASFFRFSS